MQENGESFPGEGREDFSSFMDNLTRLETALVSRPEDPELQEQKRRLWANATDRDLRDWAGLQTRLTQDPDAEITAGFDEILQEAERLRAQARNGEPGREASFSRAGREEWDQLKGQRGDKEFEHWAHGMEKQMGVEKKDKKEAAAD